jgi:hypothetical protein
MHRVRAQTLQAAQALETVDDQVCVVLCHDHDRYLLALLGERGQELTLVLGMAQTQILVASVKLMKFQVHGVPPFWDRGAGEVAATGIFWWKTGSGLFTCDAPTGP